MLKRWNSRQAGSKMLLLLFGMMIGWACQSGRDKLISTIHENDAKLFADTLHKLNTDIAASQVEAYKSFAVKYPADSLAPEYLIKGADLANGLGNGAEAVQMLESLRRDYPNHSKAGTALFMEAFFYETSIHDNEKAIEKYSEFIRIYPAHQLAQAAEFSLIQLKQGMSAEDMVKMFEAKNDSAAKTNQ